MGRPSDGRSKGSLFGTVDRIKADVALDRGLQQTEYDGCMVLFEPRIRSLGADLIAVSNIFAPNLQKEAVKVSLPGPSLYGLPWLNSDSR